MTADADIIDCAVAWLIFGAVFVACFLAIGASIYGGGKE